MSAECNGQTVSSGSAPRLSESCARAGVLRNLENGLWLIDPKEEVNTGISQSKAVNIDIGPAKPNPQFGRIITRGRHFMAEVDGLQFVAIAAGVLFHISGRVPRGRRVA